MWFVVYIISLLHHRSSSLSLSLRLRLLLLANAFVSPFVRALLFALSSAPLAVPQHANPPPPAAAMGDPPPAAAPLPEDCVRTSLLVCAERLFGAEPERLLTGFLGLARARFEHRDGDLHAFHRSLCEHLPSCQSACTRYDNLPPAIANLILKHLARDPVTLGRMAQVCRAWCVLPPAVARKGCPMRHASGCCGAIRRRAEVARTSVWHLVCRALWSLPVTADATVFSKKYGERFLLRANAVDVKKGGGGSRGSGRS